MTDTTTTTTTESAAPPAAGTPPAAPPPASASAFAVQPAEGDGLPNLAAGLPETIPAKYHVKAADGTLDVEATAAKLAEAHKSLETRMGKGEAPPETVEGYEPKLEGYDLTELKADEKYQSFLKGAHARGINNDQLSYVLGEYAARAAADQQIGMSTEDLRAAMSPEWEALGGYDAGINLGRKAIKAFAPDATADELNSLPNHPLVARILAGVGRELGEDRLPGSGDTVNVGDWEQQSAAIRASDSYNQPNHPEHKQAVDKLEALYAQRYGKQKRVMNVTASVKT